MSEPFEIVAEPEPPRLPGQVTVRPTLDTLMDALAVDVLLQAQVCCRVFGDFHFALGAGAIDERLAVRLLVDPRFRGIPWQKTHLWVLADRGRPGDSASGRLLTSIAEAADVPESQVHPMTFDHGAGGASYEAALRENLGWREPGQDRLDFALVALDHAGGFGVAEPILSKGMQAAAKASLAESVLDETGDETIALTLRTVNAARSIAVVASGTPCHEIVKQYGNADCSLSTIKPLAGSLAWFLDEPAAHGEPTVPEDEADAIAPSGLATGDS